MFTLSPYRVRAYLRGKRLADQDRKLSESRTLHIKRTNGEVRIGQSFGVEPTIYPCRVILNDFSPEGIYIFSEVPLDLDIQVALTIEDPCRLYFNGRVVWCKRLSLHQNVMGAGDFAYRIAIRFNVHSEAERQELRQIYQDLLKNHLMRQRSKF